MKPDPNLLPQIPQVNVKSSNLKSVGYDKATGHMQVTFHSGDTYDYLNVPPSAHGHLMAAKSKGKFLDDGIKTRFRHIKRK